MKLLYTLIFAFFISCSTEPENCAGVEGGNAVEDCAGVCGGERTQQECDACETLIFDCLGECEGSAVIDECGVCGGDGEVTTNVPECSWQYVCGYATVQLGANSYCADSCGLDGNFCAYNGDCYFSNGFSSSGCNDSAHCVTTSAEYICGDEYVCIDNFFTACP